MTSILDTIAANSLFSEFIAMKYNKGKGLFSKKLDPLDVLDIVHGTIDPPKGINAQQVIAIAKEVCQVISVIDKSVCPFINGM